MADSGNQITSIGLPPVTRPDGREPETLADCRAYVLAFSALQAQPASCGGADTSAIGPFRFIAPMSFGRALHGVSGIGRVLPMLHGSRRGRAMLTRVRSRS